MIRGSVLLATCVGLWSCSSGDPTSSQAGVPDKIVSLPSIIFINVDSATNIGFQLVDALDGQIPSEFTITNTSSYFDVTIDSMFRPVYNADGTLVVPAQPTEIRATITGLTAGKDSFLVSASGKSLYIPVQVIPNTLAATFSSLTPGLSDTVTITAPANVLFTPTSVVTFPGAATASYQIGVDPAGSWIKVFVAANTHASAQITNVTLTSSPTLRFTYRTTDTVTAQTLTALPATFSTLTPSGPPVVMTMNAGFQLGATSAVTFPGSPTAPAPIINTRIDSTAINMSIGPNVNSPVRVTLVHAKNVPQITYTLASAASMVSPVIANFPATLSVTNPQVGATTVITATGTDTFVTAPTVSWATGKAAIVVSRTSTTLTVIPQPGSAGAPTVAGVINAGAPAFALTLPAAVPTGLTMQATTIYTSSSPAAATPAVTAPGFYDNSPLTSACAATGNGGGAGCQYYKLVLAAAGSHTFTITWNSTDDLGLYFMDSAFNGAFGGGCDAKGNGAAGQPETCTIAFPAAGTYYLEVADYGPFYPAGTAPTPTWIKVVFN